MKNTKFITGVTFLVCLLLILLPATTIQGFLNYEEVRTVTVYAPAVSSGGQGVLSKVVLAIARPGEGRVFFSALPYTEVETQGAARIAAYIASIVARVDFFEYDYYVLVESTVPLIGGPSAGGLIAVGIAALLLNSTLDSNVTMTGMINPDGTIGPVGGLKEKLEAAASSGFKVFLIPRGQRTYTYPVYTERRIGRIVIRQVTYRSIDLVEYGRSLGVQVVEVGDLVEALYYFTGYKLSAPSTTAQTIYEDVTVLNTLREYFKNVVEEAKHYTSLATKIALSASPSYIRQYYISTLRSINETLERYTELFNNYPFYASYKILDLFELATRSYYSLLDSSTALSEAQQVIGSFTSGTQTSTCTLENSIVQGLVTTAWLYYTYAENSTTRDYQATYLSKAIRLIVEAKLYASISEALSLGLNLLCDPPEYTRVYSHVMAVHTYISRLLEEVGAGSEFLDKAAPYVYVLNTAYSQHDVATYGLAIYTLAYSTAALHDALGSSGYINYDSLINALGESSRSIVSYYLARAALEARSYGDAYTGLKLLQLYIFASQIQIIVPGILKRETPNTHRNQVGQSTIPFTSTIPKDTETESKSKAGNHEFLMQTTLLLIAILVLIVATLAALYKWRVKSPAVNYNFFEKLP